MAEELKADVIRNDRDAAVPEVISILPLRDAVLFPQAMIPLAAGRESSVKLVEDAVRTGIAIGAFGQLDPALDKPLEADLHRIGTYTSIHKVLRQQDGSVRMVVHGLTRVRLLEVVQTQPFMRARVEQVGRAGPEGRQQGRALLHDVAGLQRDPQHSARDRGGDDEALVDPGPALVTHGHHERSTRDTGHVHRLRRRPEPDGEKDHHETEPRQELSIRQVSIHERAHSLCFSTPTRSRRSSRLRTTRPESAEPTTTVRADQASACGVATSGKR